MKTTIDIPESTLEEAMRLTGAKTKREAVLRALDDFNRRMRVDAVCGRFGTWEIASNEEIEAGDLAEIEVAAKRSRK